MAPKDDDTKVEIDNVKLSDVKTSPEGDELTEAEQDKVAGAGYYPADPGNGG
jgi:hypothetical protein